MSTERSTWVSKCTGPTFVFPSSCEEKSMWNGRLDDFMMSSCKRVDPFASTTLSAFSRLLYKLSSKAIQHEVSLFQPVKSRFHIRPAFTAVPLQHRLIHSPLMLDQTLPLCSCQEATSFFLTPSSHCAGVTPLASNSQFSTRRCVTSISSTGWEASRRVRVSLKNPARQSAASWGSDSDGRAGIAGAVSRACRMEEYQSTQVPMRSKTMALGTAGDVDTADIATDVSLQVKMKNMNGLLGQSTASSRDMVG